MDLEKALEVILERRAFFAGEVNRPGRYEGEAPYVAYFDQLPGEDGLLVDDSESECTRWWWIEEGDVVLFPELKGRKRVAVLTRNDGFVVEVQDVDMAVNAAVKEGVNGNDTVVRTVKVAVQGAVEGAVYDVVDDAIDYAVRDGVTYDVRSTVNYVVNYDVLDAVYSAVEEEINE